MNASNNKKSLKNGGRHGATANVNIKKAMLRGTPPKFLYNRYFCSTFVRQLGSDAELEQYRRANTLHQHGLKDGRIYFDCSRKGCPYKMTAIKNERQEWAVYDKNAHNHKIVPFRPYNFKRREQKEKASGSLPGQLSAETRQNAAEIDRTCRFRLTFVRQLGSDAELEQYRRANALNQQRLKDGRIYLHCSRKGCPYKMTAIKNERQEWAVYDKNAHNHSKIIPIGQYHAGKRELKEKASGNLSGKLSAETRQNAAEIDTTPTTSSAAAAGGAKIQNSAQQTPSPPAKLFELAQCEKEMRQIATKWNLLFSEKRGSYLFMPPRDTKAFKDGVLLSLTDRGDHIRMDEFRAFRSQVDKIQRWPKERGEATIMRLASDQCARMFANYS
ncbi:hypothetical protein niasHS_013631 [Heterodera schachtii]|uniref:Uncharacterized protein n=1 Tax=Heterodera schachtii TaxID=97005 RepID=A0ABD2IGC3_HETSC